MNREDGTKLWLAFKYERFSDFCYKCCLISHTESACSMPESGDSSDSDPRLQFRPWLRGQYMGENRSPENCQTNTRNKKHENQEINVQCLTLAPSSFALEQSLRQNRKTLQDMSNVTQQLPRLKQIGKPQISATTTPPDLTQMIHVSDVPGTTSQTDLEPYNEVSPKPRTTLPKAQVQEISPNIVASPLDQAFKISSLPTELSLIPVIASPPRPNISKRKNISPQHQLFKIRCNDYLETVHEAMASMNIATQWSLVESQQSNQVTTKKNCGRKVSQLPVGFSSM